MTTVFLDCETLALDRAAPIWEFAAIRIGDDGHSVGAEHFQIKHDDPGGHWLATLPQFLIDRYRADYNPDTALPPFVAALRIAAIVGGGAVIAGSNPAFDMERLGDLLAANGFTPGWHYHPCDVPSIAIGWLAAHGKAIPRPWKSDAISRAVGVDPVHYPRHTAMGDVLWTLDLYTRIFAEDVSLAAEPDFEVRIPEGIW